MGLSALRSSLELGSAAPLKHRGLASGDLKRLQGLRRKSLGFSHFGSFRGWCDQAPDIQRTQLSQGQPWTIEKSVY